MTEVRVCPHCFGETEFRRRIEKMRPQFPNEKCTFHERYKGVPIQAVAAIVDSVFREHYGIGEYDSFLGGQEGDPLVLVIGELLDVEDDLIAEAFTEQLIEGDDYWPPDGAEPFYADDQDYIFVEREDHHQSYLWDTFRSSILHEQRFFNSVALGLIEELFEGIQYQRDIDKRSPIYEIKPEGPQSKIFRGRIANGWDMQQKIAGDPGIELGPPPSRSRRAGRMNPAGISCLYGAFDFPTCIAELRPAVGGIVVGVGFELARPIFVLDTTRFEAPSKPISLFNENYMERKMQWKFMQRFRWEIAKPISPNDEHLDYIPSQAVAEFLLHHYKFKRNGKTIKLEGIIYRSAQNRSGKNIALLGDAAHLVPGSVESEALDIDGLETLKMPPIYEENPVRENPALRVSENSLKAMRVLSAQYDTDDTSGIYNNYEELDF